MNKTTLTSLLVAMCIVALASCSRAWTTEDEADYLHVTSVQPGSMDSYPRRYKVVREGDSYTYPRESYCYRYQRFAMEAEVDHEDDSDEATLFLRVFPSTAKAHHYGVATYYVVQSASVGRYPFTEFKPVKRKRNTWTFKGELKVEPRVKAVPEGKDLYMNFKVKFRPKHPFSNPTSYRLKTRKVAK